MKKVVYETEGVMWSFFAQNTHAITDNVHRLESAGYHVTLSRDEPDIRKEIQNAVHKFMQVTPMAEGFTDGPNLLILGPEEYEQLISEVRALTLTGISHPSGTRIIPMYNGMRVIQSKEPGITVARETPR